MATATKNEVVSALNATLAASPTTPTPTVIEWGVRWNRTDDGSPVYVACDDRAEAEEMIYNDGEPWLPETNPTLVRRTVTAWTVADAPAADDEGGQEISPGADAFADLGLPLIEPEDGAR